MSNKCLYCYQPLKQEEGADFHEACSLSFFGTKVPPVLDYSLDQMAELGKNVVQRSIAVPGVQPKLSLTLIGEEMTRKGTRLTIVGELGGNYIFKPPSEFYPEMPANEHLTMRLAEEAFGIRTVPSSLIRLRSGEMSYITRRIDRTPTGEKIHMLDMFQILEAFDKYKSSMERIGKALSAYSSNTLLDQLYYFELALFSFLTGNNDMHLKNFSMINTGDEWSLAPAYDLLNAFISNPDDKEELALPIEGKKKKLHREHFERLAQGMGLNDRQINGVFNRFLKSRPIANSWIKNSFLSEAFQLQYQSVLANRYTSIV